MSKSSLDELLEVADRLCNNLDEMSENRRRFCAEMQIAFEQWSADISRSSSHIKELKNNFGEYHD
jgi:hypothetical protein